MLTAENELPEMRPIPGFPDYYVTATGHIYSSKNGALKRRKEFTAKNGYLTVTTKNKGRAYSLTVHKAVALAYIGPSQHEEIRHLDGNKLNNDYRNLKYGTKSENALDSVRHGTNWAKQDARNKKIAAFKRLNEYAADGYLPLRTNKKENAKRVRIWNALRKKLKRDAAQIPATKPTKD